MSEHDFVSLGIPLGTSRLTISATTVAAMNGYLVELTEDDPIEGVAPVDTILDTINTINAAVNLKMPQFAPPAASAPVSTTAPAATPAQQGKTCPHGPMTYREGTVKSGQNAGKAYKGYFCPAPRGANQCKPEFIND